MPKENNKMQVDIDTLKKQNVNDLLSIKELYSKLEELGEKITQVKYIDNTLVKKIKKEYGNLKKIILDENIQVQLDNKIDEFNLKLTHDIETINSQLNNNIETINSQLDKKASKKYSTDKINVTQVGVDNTGVSYSSDLINDIIQKNNYSTLFFEDGEYLIDKPLLLNNYCNIELGANATLKAICPMTSLIIINRTTEKHKQYICGGILDGNGIADEVLTCEFTANHQVYNMVIKNAKNTNINLKNGYEIYLSDIRIDNELVNNETLTGLICTSTDSVIENIIVKNNKIGVVNNQVSNDFKKIHVWNNKVEILDNTIGFIANVNTLLDNFYSDTCVKGLVINNNSIVSAYNSRFLSDDKYLTQVDKQAILIDTTGGTANLYNCRLTSYGNSVKLGSVMSRIFLYDCTTSSPFNCDDNFCIIKTYNKEFYRVKLSEFTVNANSYKRVTIPIEGLNYMSYYNINIINDSHQFIQYKSYLQTNKLIIIFTNSSNESITLSNLKVNFSIVNNGTSNLPITNIDYTVN